MGQKCSIPADLEDEINLNCNAWCNRFPGMECDNEHQLNFIEESESLRHKNLSNIYAPEPMVSFKFMSFIIE